MCCAAEEDYSHEKDYSHELWRTDTLRLTPQFACLVSGNLAEDRANAQQGQSATFTVPASVRNLHLLSAGDRRETKPRPILAATPLQELNIDLDAWDAAVVRPNSTKVLLAPALLWPA